jgi:hypothetical protein
MAKSTRPFARWDALEESTWSFRVFSQYDTQLMGFWGTHLSSTAFTYSQLGKTGASWTDSPGKHFRAGVEPDSFCPDLRTWSALFNSFGDWINLSIVLTLAANLETYMASVIRLALESDPAVLLGTPHAIDGIEVLKHRKAGAIIVSDHIEACTKGEWSSRLAALTRIFGTCPQGMLLHHSALEELRKVRNRFGHAFGREIEEARRMGSLDVPPMEKVKRTRVEKLRHAVLGAARALDQHLLKSHIGEFEALQFYHRLYPSLNQDVPSGQRAYYLKKAIGVHGAVRGKALCKGLVDYYEAL